MQLLIDGHLDVAYNALSYERDQTLSIEQLRQREAPDGGAAPDGRGTPMVSLPELRRANVVLFVGTVLARAKPWVAAGRKPSRASSDWPSQDMTYAVAQGQLAYYRLLEQRGQLELLTDRAGLDAHCERWQSRDGRTPVGLILMMEGADPIVEPDQVHAWFDQGLRCVSLAHFGQSHYAAGTPPPDPKSANHEPGGRGLTERGRLLLGEIEKLSMAVDLTHLTDAGFHEIMDAFGGPVCATHANARALVPGIRQLSDEQIRQIQRRDGVIGIALYNGMIRGAEPPRREVGLKHLVDHIDHVCQLAGDAEHVAIGSDLDGGFGLEHTPRELHTYAGLHDLAPLLRDRGFSGNDTARIYHGNWLRFFRRVLGGDEE